MPSVASSAINRIDYIAEMREFHVVFTSGRRYRYLDVPPAIYLYLQFKNAASKGAFFNEAVRDAFEYEELHS